MSAPGRAALSGPRVAVLLALLALPALAQRGGFRGMAEGTFAPNVRYDGRFTFARIAYNRERYAGATGPSQWVMWSHDYPKGDAHITKIVAELSTLWADLDHTNIFYLDDPELTKFPFAYLCEPGAWQPSAAEVEGMRNYLAKGGFVLVDDIGANQWSNMEAQLRRVLPDLRLLPVPNTHPIFDSFFRIRDPVGVVAGAGAYRGVPEYYGLYEDNDPSKRLMMIVNYKGDVSEYWEWSDQGNFAPITETNDAYKLGVNYVIYALTH